MRKKFKTYNTAFVSLGPYGTIKDVSFQPTKKICIPFDKDLATKIINGNISIYNFLIGQNNNSLDCFSNKSSKPFTPYTAIKKLKKFKKIKKVFSQITNELIDIMVVIDFKENKMAIKTSTNLFQIQTIYQSFKSYFSSSTDNIFTLKLHHKEDLGNSYTNGLKLFVKELELPDIEKNLEFEIDLCQLLKYGEIYYDLPRELTTIDKITTNIPLIIHYTEGDIKSNGLSKGRKWNLKQLGNSYKLDEDWVSILSKNILTLNFEKFKSTEIFIYITEIDNPLSLIKTVKMQKDKNALILPDKPYSIWIDNNIR